MKKPPNQRLLNDQSQLHLIPIRCDASRAQRQKYAKNQGRGATGFVLKGAIRLGQGQTGPEDHGSSSLLVIQGHCGIIATRESRVATRKSLLINGETGLPLMISRAISWHSPKVILLAKSFKH
jgi:hypothetical protein